jgi:TonB family protein
MLSAHHVAEAMTYPRKEYWPARVAAPKLREFLEHTLNSNTMTKNISGLALVLAASLLPMTVHAQKSQNDASSSREQTYLDFQVEQPAKIKVAAAPVYPERLRSARVEGRVLVQFVVDERGKPEMPSFKVIRSSDAELTESVRTAVGGMTFFPAEAGGQKVKQLVQVPFNFAAR